MAPRPYYRLECCSSGADWGEVLLWATLGGGLEPLTLPSRFRVCFRALHLGVASSGFCHYSSSSTTRVVPGFCVSCNSLLESCLLIPPHLRVEAFIGTALGFCPLSFALWFGASELGSSCLGLFPCTYSYTFDYYLRVCFTLTFQGGDHLCRLLPSRTTAVNRGTLWVPVCPHTI